MKRSLALIAVIGCGRVGFEPSAVDATVVDATVVVVDVSPDARPFGPGPCQLPTDGWQVTPPTLATDINELLMSTSANGDRNEYDPVFSTDGLTLYLSSDQGGGFQSYALTRTTVTDPFTAISLQPPDVNTGSVFGFQRLGDTALTTAQYGSPVGGFELWRGDHASGTWSWTLSALSTTMEDFDAQMTSDGLAVYLPRDGDLVRATRAAVTDDFTNLVPLTGINSAATEESPAVGASNTGLLFVSDLAGQRDLYFAERTGATSYAAPYLLEGANSSVTDGEPALHEPTCELLFASTRGGGTSNLYRAEIQPR